MSQSAQESEMALLAAMKEMATEASRLESSATNDAFPKSDRVRFKRQRAAELRGIRNRLDAVRSTLATGAISATEIVLSMPLDGGNVVFVWHAKSGDPVFRKVPVNAVIDAVLKGMDAATPTLPGKVLPIKGAIQVQPTKSATASGVPETVATLDTEALDR